MVVTWDLVAENNSKPIAFKGILPALALAFVFGPGGNLSRAADAAATTTGPPELGEVIVTAQKREQNLQDVPIAVIALSGQQLQDAGVTNIKNMAELTPGLTVTSTTSENSTTARIRGIGTVGDNVGLESSVGVVIDGVYRPRNGVGFGDLGDIANIQVLEGPQGELFGKNNDAGVIVIETKRPSRTFGVSGEITGGNFGDKEISGSITGPAGGFSAFRLYAEYKKRDGFLDVETGTGNSDDAVDNRNLYLVRGEYLITPSNDLSVLLIGDFSRRNEMCCQATPVYPGPFAGIITAPVPAGTGNLSGYAHEPLQPPVVRQLSDFAADLGPRIFRPTRLGSRWRSPHLDQRLAGQQHRRG